MIGLVKNALKGKENVQTATFHSFGEKENSAGNLRPETYMNCDCRGGVLRGGIGVEKCLDKNGKELTIKMANNAAAMNTFFATLNTDGVTNTSAVYIVGLDGYLYLRNESSGVGWQRVLLGGNVVHCALKEVNKTTYNIFCGAKGAFATLDGAVFRNIFNEATLGACVCGKRFVILTAKGEIRYMPAISIYQTDANDFNLGGSIYLPAGYGAPIAIRAYGGCVYVFFERGICKVSLFAEARKNTLKEISYHGGNICAQTQAITNEGIIFLANEGVYYLRNDRVERICEDLPIGPCMTNQNSGVGYCDDGVIFSYYKKTGTGSEIKRIFIYKDGKDGYFTDVYGALGGNEYAYIQGVVYRYVKDGAGVIHNRSTFFTSEPLRFGTNKKKRLKTLLLKGEGSLTVGVKSGDREHKYDLVFKNGVAKTKLFDKGEAFSFTFYLDSGAAVESMETEYITEK